MPKTWIALSFLLSISWAAQAAEPPENRLDPFLKILYRAQTDGDLPGRAAGAVRGLESIDASEALGLIASVQAGARLEGERKLDLLFEFYGDEDELAAAGMEVRAKIGVIHSGRLEASRLGELLAVRGLRYVQLSHRLRAFQTPGPASGAVPPRELETPELPARATPGQGGSGVLIGFIDTGVDIFHQDFRKADGSTRIKYLLDLSDPGDVDGDGDLDGPDDLGGTLYTEQEINLALRSSRTFPARDTTGHGTHGLSIAAGDDPRLPGLAPGADLVVVKATREDGTLEFQSTDVLGALSFINRKAAELEMPYVVNLSLGTIFASHDGRALEEIAIDSLVGPGIPGKAVVLAAGNAADNRGANFRHFSGRVFAGMTSRHTLTLPVFAAPRPGPGNDQMLLDLWFEGRDRLAITVTAPDGVTRVHAPYGEVVSASTPFGQILIGNPGGQSPLNGDTEAIVFIDDQDGTAPEAGDWTISLTGEKIQDSGLYHGWLIEGSSVGDAEPRISRGGDNRYLVAKPGGAFHGITVGSFARHTPGTRFLTSWTDVGGRRRADPSALPEEISGFSSTGPTRDGRIKPEIAAPGEQVVGAISRDAYPGRSPASLYNGHPFQEIEALVVQNAPERAFGVLQGTSFSAPVVTGLVALLLAADPRLDAVEVRNVLVNRAIPTRFTGRVPNDRWGYGGIDLALARSPRAALSAKLRIDQDSLPDGVQGRPYAFALTASGGRLPYSWSVKGTLPPGLLLKSGALLAGTPTRAGTYSFTLEARDAARPGRTDVARLSITILERPPLSIVTRRLPSAKLREPYSLSLSAEGGTPPYTWSLRAGSLAPGFALTPRGELQGTPGEAGSHPMTIRVTDSASGSALRSFSLEISQFDEGGWRPLGIVSGDINALAIDPGDPQRLYAATGGSSSLPGQDLAESVDGGETWRLLTVNNLFSGPAKRLAVNPATSRVWAIDATGLPLVYDPVAEDWTRWGYCDHDRQNGDLLTRVEDLEFDDRGGLYVYAPNASCPGQPSLSHPQSVLSSSDDGKTWRLAGKLPVFPPPKVTSPDLFAALEVFGPDPRVLYLGRAFKCGIRFCNYPPEAEQFFSSGTGGETWNPLEVRLEAFVVPVLSQKDPMDILRYGWNRGIRYAHRHLLERSRDGGQTWTELPIPEFPSICLLERSRTHPDILVAGTSRGLYRSLDGGRTWAHRRITGLPYAAFCDGGTLAIDPTNPERLLVGLPGNPIFESTDGGDTWRSKGRGPFRRPSSGLAIRRDLPSELFVMAAGAPHVSRREGRRWTETWIDLCAPDEPYFPCSFSSKAGRRTAATAADSAPVTEPYSFPIIAPNNADFYLFLDAGGERLYRSENRGVTWATLFPDFSGDPGSHFFESLAADPFDADTLLARVHRRSGTVPATGVGIWRSEDRGLTWSRVGDAGDSPTGNLPQTRWESGIAFAANVEGRVYALGADGLYRSDNKGSSWQLFVPLPHQSAFRSSIVDAAPSDSEYVYIARHDTMFVRDPSSGEVHQTSIPLHSITSLAVDARNPRMAYLGMDYVRLDAQPFKNGSGGIWKTSDAGKTWKQLPGFSSSLSVVSLAAHPTDSGILYAATREDGVYQTADSGVTWSSLNHFSTVADTVNAVIPDPEDLSVVYVATQGFGVQVLLGGNSFIPHVQGLGNFNVLSLALDPENLEVLYGGTEKGLFKANINRGLEWEATGLVDGIVTDIAIDTGSRPRRIKITTFNGGVAVSEDEGRTFQTFRAGLGSLALTSIENEVRDSSSRTWVTMHGGEGVAYSEDGGKTWKPAAGNGLRDRNVNDLVLEPPPGRRIWIATDTGVFWSADQGLSWQELSSGLPPNVPVSSIAVDPNSGEVLVSLLSEEEGGVYRGGNLRGLWSPLNGGLEDLSVRKLTHDDGRSSGTGSPITVFYAATSEDGFYTLELKSSVEP